MVMAYLSGGYSLKVIGEHFGLHYSRVSRVVAATEKARPSPACPFSLKDHALNEVLYFRRLH